MSDLRDLLMDCRIALRQLPSDDVRVDLMSRLEGAIARLANETPTPKTRNTPLPVTAASDKSKTEQNVAFAWQRATRDLKFSHPELYESLSKKVLASLDTDIPVDSATEFKQLQNRIDEKQKEHDQVQKQLEKIQREYYELAGALASAVPELKDYGDILAVGLARVKALVRQRELGQLSAAPSASAVSAERFSPVPTSEHLAEVIAGRSIFSKEQREWSVSEAMVLSGFQYTPVELLEKGDGFIASILQNKQKM
jgi:hypothetical protein